MINCGIIGTGKYIPSRKVDNKFVARKTKTSKDWIYKKTGIKQRFFANKEDFTQQAAGTKLDPVAS